MLEREIIMKKTTASNSEILLAIIAAADGKELSRVHLQKVAFLVSEEFKDRLSPDFYKFDKKDYGPFCIDIYDDTAMLEYWGRIRTKHGAQGNDESYVVANDVSFNRLQLDNDIKQYIKHTVNWVADMSFGQLVRTVYRLYPEYLERSTFKFDKEQAIHESFERSLKQLQDGQTTLASDFIDELHTAARENE